MGENGDEGTIIFNKLGLVWSIHEWMPSLSAINQGHSPPVAFRCHFVGGMCEGRYSKKFMAIKVECNYARKHEICSY